MSMTTPKAARKAGGPGRKRVWRLNLRAVAILAVVLLLCIAGLVLALILRPANDQTWVVRARQQIEAGRGDLALSFLNEALRCDPRNVEALDLKAELLDESARGADDLMAAIKLGEQSLRLEPDGPNSQATRRRLVELHLKVAPYQPEPKLRYELADILARELIAKGARDAEALRLRARVQEGLAESAQLQEALDLAIQLYEQARQLEPAHVAGAERLALLYREKKNDPERGRRVLDDLLAAAPDSADVRLARNRYDDALAQRAENQGDRKAAADLFTQADTEIERAVAMAPDRLDVRLQAADYSLRRGRPEVARQHLKGLSEEDRRDPRVRALEGLSHLQQNRASEAIEDWRQGLVLSNGTDSELTWRLAFVLLQTGRIDEASPLIEQYRRLDGREEPGSPYLYLKGLEQFRRNQPAEAIELLQQARRGAPEALVAQLEFAIGRCFEAVRDEAKALERYQHAINADPRLPAPRLARIRILQARRPDEAEQEVRQALERLGDEPDLLVTLARMEFQEQIRLPRDQRDWNEVQQLVERAGKLAPAAPSLVQLQADLLAAQGRGEEAIALLEQANQHQKADVELWLARVDRLSRKGQIESALAVIDQAMAPEAAGDKAPLRIARARLLTLRGRGQEAREGLVRDLDQLPPDQRPDVWKALGDLYAEQRNPVEARRAYGQWADALPDDPLPHLFLLELALDDGDRPAADKQIARIKEISGQDGFFWRIARVQELLRSLPGESAEDREARYAEAETLIGAIEAESPQERFGPMLRGRLCELRGQKADAAAAFEEALQHDGGPIALQHLVQLYNDLDRPADLSRLRREHGDQLPRLDRALAEAAFHKGDLDRAITLAQEVIKDDPEGLETRVWYARLLSSAERPDEALATLRELIAKQPDQIGPRLILVMFHAGRGQNEQARQAVLQIIQNVKGLEQPEFIFAQCWRIAGDRDQADAAYQAALAKWPNDARVVRGAAGYFEKSGRVDEAERILRDALKLDPSQRWAVRALALLRSNQKGAPDAWREALELVGGSASEADEPEDRLVRGIVLVRGPEAKHRQEAVAILDPLLKDLPADVPSAGIARSVLMQLYLRDGRLAEAAEVAAIDAEAPNAPPAALNRYADLLLAAGKPDRADRPIKRLEAIAPDDLNPALLRARLLKLQDRDDEAAALIAKTFDDHAQDPDALAKGQKLLDALLAIDPKAAEDLAGRLVETWPTSAWLLAAVQARQGNVEKALTLYRDAAAAAGPADLREIVQGIVALAANAPPKDDRLLALADEALNAAIAREPGAADLLVSRGYLRHMQGRYAEEVRIYEDALKKNPKDLSFLNNLAWALCEGLDKPEDALTWINRAFAESPQVYPQFYDTRGVIQTRLGQLDPAIADLERACQDHPSGTILAHLARAYHQADRPIAFRSTLDRIRQTHLQPDDLEPRDRRELTPLLFSDEAARQP